MVVHFQITEITRKLARRKYPGKNQFTPSTDTIYALARIFHLGPSRLLVLLDFRLAGSAVRRARLTRMAPSAGENSPDR